MWTAVEIPSLLICFCLESHDFLCVFSYNNLALLFSLYIYIYKTDTSVFLMNILSTDKIFDSSTAKR